MDFSVFSGAEIQPHSQWNLGYFFNFEKNHNRMGFSFSQHTQATLQFNGNSMCNS